ncbi:hypothetical protein C8Q72DRAFT_199926 [Fomitopsis betulina]|nr:hypothetical protein C8Q72DRAFT_199926 [Fomitopsis betulina]
MSYRLLCNSPKQPTFSNLLKSFWSHQSLPQITSVILKDNQRYYVITISNNLILIAMLYNHSLARTMPARVPYWRPSISLLRTAWHVESSGMPGRRSKARTLITRWWRNETTATRDVRGTTISDESVVGPDIDSGTDNIQVRLHFAACGHTLLAHSARQLKDECP